MGRYFECLVERGGVLQKIIRFFSDAEYAYAWLEIEGYKVIRIKAIKEKKDG